MNKVELLAPAGDFECLKQAVWAKANAVYFGAKNFNARTKAQNFGADLKSAVSFCHMHDVKAYLTLNTLIENEQVDDVVKTIKNALECGIDAFIVQDFGVLNIIKNCFNNVEIHASTQMAVNNYFGAKKAEELGIKRVVLSRETNLEDIKLIKQNTNLEIEYFVQGALCVCFSGNCYLSSKLFGKSGNKGECLQPCRLPYKAVLKGKTIKEGYLLSAKDLCFAVRLKELIDAGVDSFKIEGRLRRSGYVAGVTRAYRHIIDNNFEVTQNDINNIKKSFNRGDYTPGYFAGNGGIIDYNIQGHKGLKIGKVVNFNKGKKFNQITIETNFVLNRGDGLKFIFNGTENASVSAVDIRQNGNIATITTTSCIKTGSEVYLILDSKKEASDTQKQSILPISFKLIANAGKPIRLEYNFKNVSGFVLGDVCEVAQNQPLDFNSAKAQLEKLGDTYFYLKNFEIETNGVFVKKQELNNLRKQAVELIQQEFLKETKVDVNYEYLNQVKNIIGQSFYNLTLKISDGFNSDANFMVVRPKNYQTFDYSKITHKNAFLYVPSFLRNEDIEVINGILNANEKLGVYSENIGALNFNKKTILGAKLNIKNIFAVKELLNKNVVAVVASPEISQDNFKIMQVFSSVPIIKSSFENFDLMTLIHCPIKTIFGNNCANCKYSDGIVYKMENGTNLKLNRYTVKNCYFTLSL